ncbi:MAG: hypothetical protein QNJ13_08810 [Paracoccaceae bacterium]|nr:hypothetical protein [Paracoccaceae bacterium]
MASHVSAVLAALLMPALAQAACPPGPEIEEPSARLILELREAENEMAARALNAELWTLWLQAPDAEAQSLLDDGIARLRVADHAGAEAAFTALIAYCPDYAEGYNQRAFSAYLRGDYGQALEDLDLALVRRPTHIGALSGRALTLMGLGRVEAGQRALRDALALNPWLSERHLLIETPGEDL